MEGRQEIIEAIQKEYSIGLGRLPAYGFSGMFKKKEEELIHSSMESMKHWLGIIKQGRIVYKDPNRVTDGFSQPGALQKSLNLLELNEDDLEWIIVQVNSCMSIGP